MFVSVGSYPSQLQFHIFSETKVVIAAMKYLMKAYNFPSKYSWAQIFYHQFCPGRIFMIMRLPSTTRNFVEVSRFRGWSVSRDVPTPKALRSIDPAGSRDKKKGKLIMKELPCMRRWDKNIRDEMKRSTGQGRQATSVSMETGKNFTCLGQLR